MFGSKPASDGTTLLRPYPAGPLPRRPSAVLLGEPARPGRSQHRPRSHARWNRRGVGQHPGQRRGPAGGGLRRQRRRDVLRPPLRSRDRRLPGRGHRSRCSPRPRLLVRRPGRRRARLRRWPAPDSPPHRRRRAWSGPARSRPAARRSHRPPGRATSVARPRSRSRVAATRSPGPGSPPLPAAPRRDGPVPGRQVSG